MAQPDARRASSRPETGSQKIAPTTSLHSVNVDRRQYRRRHWAFARIHAGGQGVPRYGSDDWLALADTDPRKVASVVVAAECWAREADDLVERLRLEVELSQRAFKATDDALYVARKEAHKKEWRGLSLVRGIAYADSEEFHQGGAS